MGRNHHHNGSGAGALLVGAAIGGTLVNRATRQQPKRQEVLVVQQPHSSSSYAPPNGTTTVIYVDQNQPQVRNLRQPHQPNVVILNNNQTLRAPGWRLAHHCAMCNSAFTIFNRRHHCRNCGRSVCGTHSSRTISIPHFGFPHPVRSCDSCYAYLVELYRSGQSFARAPGPPSSSDYHNQYHHQQHQQQIYPAALSPPQQQGVWTQAPPAPYPPQQHHQPDHYQALAQASPVYEPQPSQGAVSSYATAPSFAQASGVGGGGGGGATADLYTVPSATVSDGDVYSSALQQSKY